MSAILKQDRSQLGSSPSRGTRAGRVAILIGLAWFAFSGCNEELLPQEPEGAYQLFRDALFAKDTETVYGYLDKDTKKLFDERVAILNAMSDEIIRFLPQVDQKLARKQTGVVVLKKNQIKTGADLFAMLYNPEALTVTDEIRVGSDISDMEYNEAQTEVVIVTYGGDQYRLVLEDDGIWRIASWQEFADTKTTWVVANEGNLKKTIEELIKEETEELDTIIKYLLAQDQKQASKDTTDKN